MLFGTYKLVAATVLTLTTSSALALPRVHRGPTSPHPSRAHAQSHPIRKPVSAHAIDSERATQIQTALISSGYLSGAPAGAWNDETQRAMEKYQADNGWQTKLIPDSRAIIKLGLGPGTQPAAPTQSANSGSIAPVTSVPGRSADAPRMSTQ